jgi:predicted  nucleic acid-binding Zn-ribbon protein
MAEDTKIQDTEKENPDGIVEMTEEQAQEMVDAGGEKLDEYFDLVDQGKLKIIKKDEEPGSEAAPEATPDATTPAPPKEEKLDPEESLTFTVKRKELGDYKNIGEALKGASETRNFSKFQKNRIEELEGQITAIKESVPTSKKEEEALKKEKEALEAKVKELETKKPEPVAKIEDIVKFDEIPEVTDESAFEPENMKKLYKNFGIATKTITQMHGNMVNLQNENAQLKNEAKEAKTIATDLKSTTSDFLKKHETESEKTKRENEEGKLFSNLAELQAGHDDLKTKEPLRKIDEQYIGFQENLFRLAKADNADKMSAVLTTYFYDSSEVGDKLRKEAEDNGILPPDEVETYLNLRKIARVANSSTVLGHNNQPRPFTLEEAYTHVQKDSGAYNKDVADKALDKNKQFLAAKQQKNNAANTMKPEDLNDNVPAPEAATVENVNKIMEKYTYSQMKENEVLRKTVEKVLPGYFDENE